MGGGGFANGPGGKLSAVKRKLNPAFINGLGTGNQGNTAKRIARAEAAQSKTLRVRLRASAASPDSTRWNQPAPNRGHSRHNSSASDTSRASGPMRPNINRNSVPTAFEPIATLRNF